ITLLSCGSCVCADSFALFPDFPATPTQGRLFWSKAAVSSSVFLRFPLRRPQLFPRSLPSTLRDNHRDIFSVPILTTCYRREPWPYLARAFPARAFSEREASPHQPIPRQNA